MKQFLLPTDYDGHGPVTLGDKDFHYLIRVKRLSQGARLSCRLPDGSRMIMVISDIGDRQVRLSPTAEAHLDPETSGSMDIILLQCMPKGRKLDQIVRQAVEIGVARIVPLISAHTVVKPTATERERRRGDRLQRVAREAFQQSGAPRLPIVDEPTALSAVQPRVDGVSLFLHEQRLSPPLEAAVHPGYSPADHVHGPHTQGSLHQYLAENPSCIRLLVGPEGGLSEDEVIHLIEIGFVSVYLGDTVLRVETAAVFALGAIKTMLLERNSWTIDRRKNQR